MASNRRERSRGAVAAGAVTVIDGPSHSMVSIAQIAWLSCKHIASLQSQCERTRLHVIASITLDCRLQMSRAKAQHNFQW